MRICLRSAVSLLLLALAAPLFVSVASAEEPGFVSLFDGKTLEGWTRRGGTAAYKAEDGMVVGTTVEGSPNTFLCRGPYADFELELDVKCDKPLNSGIQIRSHVYQEDTPQESNPKQVRKGGVVYGYQCEIAAAESGVSGNFWDEAAAHQMARQLRRAARRTKGVQERRLEPLSDRRPGGPYPLLGQRRRLRRLP